MELEFVAVVGVGDGDQAAGSLVEACSAQRGDAVFGDDVIDGVFQGVTTLPGVRVQRMRPRPLLVVECRTRNALPPGEYMAPRAKSAWPPEDDQ